MAGAPPPVQFHDLLARVEEISQLIVRNSGEGHAFETLCKMRACSTTLHQNKPMKEMYENYENAYRDFVSARSAARRAVGSKHGLTACYEEMLLHLDQPCFFDAMEAMLDTCVAHMEIDPVSARGAMVQARGLLENYDWKEFCRYINIYTEFHSILDVLLEYILEVVLDNRTDLFFHVVTPDGAASGGMTKDDYLDQNRRILGNMGDAGVVDCLWAACKRHPTNVPAQAKMLELLHEMTRSRGVHRVRDILKIPGNMLVVEDILTDTDIGPPDTVQNILFSNVASNYVSVVTAMFNADPVFTPEEEARVVGAVHTFIARCFRNGCMTYTMLIPLLNVVVDRVRTSTLRQLTNAQIDVLCDSHLVRNEFITRRQVATLLRRARAANDIYDSSGINPMFILPG